MARCSCVLISSSQQCVTQYPQIIASVAAAFGACVFLDAGTGGGDWLDSTGKLDRDVGSVTNWWAENQIGFMVLRSGGPI